MSFEGFICWKTDDIQRVMNTEALQTAAEIFLATHHPMPMYRQSLRRVEVRKPYDQSSFLNDFLGTESFAFVPVLGSAGTGKSHLVRWLALNIPKQPNRRVILIPKGGTNLRGVVERILQGMEGPQYQEYRDRLSRATQGMTPGRARETLLGNLAVAVGPQGGGIRPGEVQGIDDDTRDAYEYLEGSLQPLLLDDLFRRTLLEDGGIIADLVRHTLGHTEVRERREARRQFSVDDLPLEVTRIENAGEAARRIQVDLAGDPELQEHAVDWMNLHLDEAIGQLLQMGGEDLTNLMRDVRADLAEQNVELILLIEDFAKLQGIERPLLEAILEQPHQPDRELCVLRTALACTTDYFKGVEDTVQQRTTFVVSLDREAVSTQSVITEEDIGEFASRYLNAVRLGTENIEAWHSGRPEDEESGNSVPNHCEDCDFRSTCHAAFGAERGVGLYPFNRRALIRMYGRVGADRFNPRLLINDVLKNTLEGYTHAISGRSFPPPALIEAFGGSRLGAAKRKKISDADPLHSGRREVLLELWGDGEVHDFHNGVHEAFALPPLQSTVEKIDEPSEEEEEEGPDDSGEKEPELPASLLSKLENLDRWQNGGELPQGLTNEVRRLLYGAILNRIDWDSEGLIRGEFAGSGKPFRPTSIAFENQATQIRNTIVGITIPGPTSSLTDASLALQGLLLYEHFGNWRYRYDYHGADYFRLYSRLLEGWSDEVLAQVKSGFVDGEPWDPVPALVEALSLGNRLLGEPATGPSRLENQVAALFSEVGANEELQRSAKWSLLQRKFLAKRQELQNALLARTGATKGGSRRVQILDSAQLLGPLRRLHPDLELTQDLPEELPKTSEYDALRQVHDALREGFHAAVQEEKNRLIEQYEQYEDLFDAEEGINPTGHAVTEAVSRAIDEGVLAGVSQDRLQSAITALHQAPLARWRNALEAVRLDPKEAAFLVQEVGGDYSEAVSAVKHFRALTEAFLEATFRQTQSRIEELEAAGGRELEDVYRSIADHFDEIEGTITMLEDPGVSEQRNAVEQA